MFHKNHCEKESDCSFPSPNISWNTVLKGDELVYLAKEFSKQQNTQVEEWVLMAKFSQIDSINWEPKEQNGKIWKACILYRKITYLKLL